MAKKNRNHASPRPALSVPPERPRYPAWLAWGAFALWGGWIFKNFLTRFPPDLAYLATALAPGQYLTSGLLKALPGHLAALAAGAFFLLSCAGLGRLLLVSVLKAGPLDRLEEAVLSAALGLGVFAQAVLALAAAGLLGRWPVLALLAVSAGLGALSLRLRPPAPAAPPSLKPDFPDVVAGAVLAAAVLINLVGALSPEIFYDSLVYHLAVPNFYVIKRGLADMPYNLYSNLFLLHGMLYAAGLELLNEMVPKLLNYSAGLIAAAAVFSIGRRHLSARAGLWAALVSYTVTLAMLTSWSSGTETLLAMFSVCSLAAALRHEPGGRKFLLLSAFLAGCGMAVKTTGLFPAIGSGLVLLYRGRSDRRDLLRAVPLFALAAALPVLPWLAKNWVYRHNPFFPFLTSVFGPGGALPQRLAGFMAETRQMGAVQFKAWLLNPWDVTMGVLPNSQYFTPLFLALLPPLFLLEPGAAAAPFWAYFLCCWLLWSVTSTMARFLMPAFPAAGLLIAAALGGRAHAALKRTLAYAVLFFCALGVYWAGLILYSQGRWRPVFGLISKDDYLSDSRPTYPYSHYAAIKFINERLPPGAKTLIIGDGRSFYMKKDFIVSSVFDRTPIVEYAAASADGDALYARLRAEGVTHLLINAGEAVKLGRSYGMFYWDAGARGVFDAFWARHVREVYSRDELQGGRFFNRVAVYELTDAPAPGARPPFNLMRDAVMRGIEAAG